MKPQANRTQQESLSISLGKNILSHLGVKGDHMLYLEARSHVSRHLPETIPEECRRTEPQPIAHGAFGPMRRWRERRPVMLRVLEQTHVSPCNFETCFYSLDFLSMGQYEF